MSAYGRSRYIWDREMQCLVEIGDGSNREAPKPLCGPAGVMRDLEPYRTAASDGACGGKQAYIGGRRQHREFLRRNGYTEVGNSFVPNQQTPMPRVGPDIKRALGE